MDKLKIIVTTDFQCDFLAHGILAGLYETGHDIYEVPALKSVRGEVDEGYILPDGQRGVSGPPGYFALPKAHLPTAKSYAEAVELMAKGPDLVVMLSARDYSRRAIHGLSRDAGVNIKSLPLVICEGEDHDYIDYRLVEEFSPRVFFKREIQRTNPLSAVSSSIHRPVWPLPFSAFTRGYDPEIDHTKKDYDLFLSLGNTHPLRLTLIKKFLEASDKKGRRSWVATNENVNLNHPLQKKLKKMLPWGEYIATQAKSKITASIRGFGRDALHAWEAFSFATLVLYCDPGIYIPFPFKDRVHCLYFSEDCSEVIDLAETFLEDSTAAWQIAQAGKRHLHQYHTNKARAEYLINVSRGEAWGKPKQYEEYGICQ